MLLAKILELEVEQLGHKNGEQWFALIAEILHLDIHGTRFTPVRQCHTGHRIFRDHVACDKLDSAALYFNAVPLIMVSWPTYFTLFWWSGRTGQVSWVCNSCAKGLPFSVVKTILYKIKPNHVWSKHLPIKNNSDSLPALVLAVMLEREFGCRLWLRHLIQMKKEPAEVVAPEKQEHIDKQITAPEKNSTAYCRILPEKVETSEPEIVVFEDSIYLKT